MTYQQLVVPDPDIPTQPGWCLQYVRQAFGAPIVEPTATAGWFNAKHRHTGTDFPEGCWVPVWFELDTEPAGHVALLAPDGSVYSTTSPTGNRATHHPNLGDLYATYAPYNPLTYRGWSEDISGVRVVQEQTLSYESITPTEEDDMFTDQDRTLLQYIAGPGFKQNIFTGDSQQERDARATFIQQILDHAVQVGDTDKLTSLKLFLQWNAYGIENIYRAVLNNNGGNINADDVAEKIIAQFGDTLAGDIVSAVGQRLAKVAS